MRMVRRWSGFLSLAIAVAAMGGTGSSVSAATMIKYSTSGTVESSGITGSPVISFKSLTSDHFNSPSFFSLGDFQVAALPKGSSTSYDNTPFHITLIVDEVDGSTPNPNGTPIIVSGHLNGTVTDNNQSTVRASFDQPSGPIEFITGDFKNVMTIPVPNITLVPSTTNNGITTAEAHLRTVALDKVPEPTSIALFLTTLAGLGLRRRLRQQRPI